MSIFSDPFKKLLSGMGKILPDKSVIRKSTKTAAVLSSAAMAARLGFEIYKKIRTKVEAVVKEKQADAGDEIKKAINESLEKFILACVLRWLIYITLIMLAYVIARAFNLRKDVLVALVILGIYTFYAIKAVRIFRWYLSFLRQDGLIINPLRLIRAYLHRAILYRVQRSRAALPLMDRLAMDFFGPASEKIAEDLTESSLQSADLRREAITRVGMWVCGWIIYALIYEKLFLLVTDIDFKAIWEPVIWPFYMLIKVLSV